MPVYNIRICRETCLLENARLSDASMMLRMGMSNDTCDMCEAK
ncbi:unnamed protein product [Haemonchus placei]|uniref:Zinc-ribbon_6 domain-containing protein n=1 Tax=Haemonchus placei TaxID=6290 RepID=A0A0N4VSA8_HAEPC|nr:unnamed protein product [Haemonchus placei]